MHRAIQIYRFSSELSIVRSLTLLQERLKKLKAEIGKVQLGNITVDMVYLYMITTDYHSSVC